MGSELKEWMKNRIYANASMPEMLRMERYKEKCFDLVVKFGYLLDPEDLDAWYEAENPCVPVIFGRLLQHDKLFRLTNG